MGHYFGTDDDQICWTASTGPTVYSLLIVGLDGIAIPSSSLEPSGSTSETTEDRTIEYGSVEFEAAYDAEYYELRRAVESYILNRAGMDDSASGEDRDKARRERMVSRMNKDAERGNAQNLASYAMASAKERRRGDELSLVTSQTTTTTRSSLQGE